MTISVIAASVKTAVTAELGKVQLPEGVVVSDELKQQFADAGVRGTLSAIETLPQASLIYIAGSEEEGTDDPESFTPGELLSELFGAVNS